MNTRRLQRGRSRPRARGFILLTVALALILVAAVAFLLNRSGGMNMSLAARGLQADSAHYVAEGGLAQINAQTQGRNCSGYTDLTASAFGADSFDATVTPTAGSPVTLVATATTAGGAAATLARSNVTVYQNTPTNTTLQAADSSGTDAWLNWTKPTTNYGAHTVLLVQSDVASGLVQFDLSGVPAGAIITGATLRLSKAVGAYFSGTIAVYRVTAPWVEASVTYSSNGTTPWTTAGGDYDPAAVATLTNIMQGWNEWNVTSLMQGWSAGSYPNYGMILVPTSSNVYADFVGSDQTGNEELFPKLVVTYTAPCGPNGLPPTLHAATKDSALSAGNATRNYGRSTTVQLFSAASPNRIAAQFNVSSVPVGTPIVSATLRLYAASISARSGAAMPLAAYAVTRSWTEGTKTGSGSADGVSWNAYDGSNNWAAGGGDYSTPAAGTLLLGSDFNSGWIELDITALAQAWVNVPAANNGVIITTSATDNFTINMRQSASNRPELVLTY